MRAAENTRWRKTPRGYTRGGAQALRCRARYASVFARAVDAASALRVIERDARPPRGAVND